jgi:hypothetical protein
VHSDRTSRRAPLVRLRMRPTSLLATLRSTSRPTLILASSASVLGLSYLALRPAFKIGNSSSRTMSSSDFPKVRSLPSSAGLY